MLWQNQRESQKASYRPRSCISSLLFIAPIYYSFWLTFLLVRRVSVLLVVVTGVRCCDLLMIGPHLNQSCVEFSWKDFLRVFQHSVRKLFTVYLVLWDLNQDSRVWKIYSWNICTKYQIMIYCEFITMTEPLSKSNPRVPLQSINIVSAAAPFLRHSFLNTQTTFIQSYSWNQLWWNRKTRSRNFVTKSWQISHRSR